MPLLAAAAMAQGSEHGVSTAVAVFLAIAGVAIIALIVSQQAQTGGVVSAGGTSLANLIKCALSPVTGGSCSGLLTKVTSTVTYP